ncbi:MAG TPA: TetR/AcrR family transcriptional regulator [Gaiellales bacterium]|nr:TetR/AcrR family transcriptional regulator [Gaiellales bacterium]
METKPDIRTAFLDAAERLLIEEGRAGISTRRVAREAGLNHGLVHYYFGSVENLMVAVFERFTDRLVERQRAMYAADVPFLEKWQTAMGFMEEDLAAGYPKIWAELQAAAMNHPELQRRIRAVYETWRSVLTDAFTDAAREYGVSDAAAPALVTLVMTFTIGMFNERLVGVDTGHAELLAWFEAAIRSMQDEAA